MKPKTDFDIVIIGGGIVGLATATQLSRRFDKLTLAVLEKEEALAQHQTGHNSGVIHSGLYYKPGSLKARTCTRGRHALVQFAKKHKIPHEICGKIVVATSSRELPRLEQLQERGEQNGVEGLKRLTADQIKEREPHCAGIEGLHVPCTGIIDFTQVAKVLAQQIKAAHADNRILTDHCVTGFDRHDFTITLRTNQGPIKTRYLINCGGLQSDRIARMDHIFPAARIVPFRGEYYDLTEAAADKVRHLIYPVPNPKFPFLGVHFTRTISGLVDCGPNAVFAFKREGYSKTAFSLKDTCAALGFGGTWKLFFKNLGYGLGEYRRSFSKHLFLKQLQRLIPDLGSQDLVPGKIGIRAQAVGKNGKPIDDFHIESKPLSIHVLNAPSPAATACLAIGEYLTDLAARNFGL